MNKMNFFFDNKIHAKMCENLYRYDYFSMRSYNIITTQRGWIRPISMNCLKF